MGERLSFASGYMEGTHSEILRQRECGRYGRPDPHGTHGEGLLPRRRQPDESDLPLAQCRSTRTPLGMYQCESLGEAVRRNHHAHRNELGNARGRCRAADRSALSLYHLQMLFQLFLEIVWIFIHQICSTSTLLFQFLHEGMLRDTGQMKRFCEMLRNHPI